MPYFITKEIINKSIINIFTKAKFNSYNLNLIEQDLINFTFNVPNNKDLCSELEKLNFDDADIFEVADMLYQLKSYKFYLSYIFQLLINSKHYNNIAKFMSRTFVNHIGDVCYVSNLVSYDFAERYFDRFIEAVKYSEIENFKIMPFLFYIYFSGKDEACNKFLRPAKEFLQKVIVNNEATFLNYINTPENYKNGYIIYFDLFETKGAQKLIENYVSENYFNKDDLIEVFLTNKEVGLLELKKFIIKSTGEKQKIALNLYLSFSQDVKNSLVELYEQVKNDEIKNILKDEIELSKNCKFETVKDFIEFIDLDIKLSADENISSKFLIYFNNGVKVNDKVLTYIFNLYKSISSPIVIKKCDYLKKFFTQTELDTLGKNLISTLEGRLTWDNKWIVALVCSLCSNEVISLIVDLSVTCVGNTELCNFVLGCLVETNAPQVVSLIKQLYLESNNKKIYYNFLEILAKNNSVNALDYLDEMVSNFGLSENATRKFVCNGEQLLFEINDNLTVKVKNLETLTYVNISNPTFADTADALKYFNDLTNEIRTQIENFKEAYKLKRTWSVVTFTSNVLSNPILKKIANTLVWGAYDKDKLVKIFQNANDVAKQENSELKIALVHPVEVESGVLPANKFEPFKQINKQVFVANNYNYSNTYTNEFNGVAINDISFNAKIRALGYKMSVGDDVYYYKMDHNSNVFIKIELSKLSTKNMSVVGNIKFYNLNLVQMVNNRFLLNITPEQIGSVNKRVYSDVLNDVYEACYY